MIKNNALNYLKYLHSVEMKYKKNILTQDIAEVIEQVRLEFVAAYRKQQGKGYSVGRIQTLSL